ncbi:MAG TPA: response regulator [Acidimicrobiales bacterium]|nr:response regulator [Acidimicrobiales bacterium]
MAADSTRSFAIVEDQPDMCVLIRLALTRDPRLQAAGEASSADEALALLDECEPALIILDHSIEGEMMGLEAAPLLKAKAAGSKILLFTAHDMSGEAASEPAVDAFLRKDRIDQLLATAQRLLGLDPAA